MITPQTRFLRCIDDRFTQVRNERAELLGCIPKLAANVEAIQDHNGIRCEVRLGVIAMICVPNDVAIKLDQFTPFDPGPRDQIDLALPPEAAK